MFSKSQERITVVFGGGEGVVPGGDTRSYRVLRMFFFLTCSIVTQVCVFYSLSCSFLICTLFCCVLYVTWKVIAQSLYILQTAVIWVWYWQCLGIPSEENHNLYQGALMRLGSSVCVSHYVTMVIKSTLVRMRESNPSLWFLCLHSTLGGTKQKRKVRGKMFPTCFKISLGLKKQQCYWDDTTTAEGDCEREHFEQLPRLKDKRCTFHESLNPHSRRPVYNHCGKWGVYIQSKSTRGSLACGRSTDSKRESAPIAMLVMIDHGDQVDKRCRQGISLPHRDHGPNGSL